MKINRYKAGAVAFGAIAMIGVTGLSAQAMAAPDAGTEHIHIVLTSPSGGTVKARRAFTASGTDTETGSNKSVFEFARGDITVTHTDDPGATTKFNADTCVGHVNGTGDYTVVNGNGIYSNIEGHGEYTFSGQWTTARENGKCTDEFVSQRIEVDAVGPVSFH